MPRIARKSFNTSFYHIIVQGLKKEYIFQKKESIEKYVKLLLEEKEKFNLEVIAYCVMSNHAHILIHTERINEMSKYMHSVNQKFAQFYNYINSERVGYVFRDRFKSEPIYNELYLIRCIRYIHNNPVKAKMVNKPIEYIYSSYKDYLGGNVSKVIKDIVDIDVIISNNCRETEVDNSFIDVTDNSIEMIQTKLFETKLKYGITLSELIENEKLLIQVVDEIKKEYKIPYKLITKELRISESTWKRMKARN